MFVESVDLDRLKLMSQRIASVMPSELVLYLHGDLGAGKTTFSQFLIAALGHTGRVKSPTYTLVESYELSNQLLYHFDLYRLGDPSELDFIGWQDYLAQQAILLVEWPEKGGGLMPDADLDITLEVTGFDARSLKIAAGTVGGKRVMEQLLHD